jgi:hypothetical protein
VSSGASLGLAQNLAMPVPVTAVSQIYVNMATNRFGLVRPSPFAIVRTS